MSRETVQFAEIVRNAAAVLRPPHFRLHYCEQCTMQRPHTIRSVGRDEIYRCQVCGYEKWYTVK